MEFSSAATAVQAREKSVHSEVSPKAKKSVTPTTFGIRRSCDACGRKKRKCDGERPCRRCVRAGEACGYSKRRCHQPQPQQRKTRQQQGAPDDPARVHPTQTAVEYSTFAAVLGHGRMLRLKRLTASPATGLVGMQENSFLCDFFGCVGFLPLTTESHIRETMVKIMLSPTSRQQSAVGDDCGEAGQSDACAMGGGFGNAFGGMELLMGPPSCIFWCAVALGALVKGSPIESVASYSQLAADALAKNHSVSADAEVAKAWTILAYVHGFMGDTAKFQKYLTLSDAFLTTSIEQGSTDALPVGFAEVIQTRESKTGRHTLEAFCSHGQVRQLNRGASEHELYRYVMQSFQAFEQAMFTKMLKRSGADQEISGCAEPASESIGEQPHRNGVPRPEEISDAMASVWIEANIVQFGPLEEAVDRPSIRAGMGGILINGYLVFEAAGKGDVRNALKRLGRCVEVFARYPGLCRSIVGSHEAHTMLAALAALADADAREMYDTLRAAYNPFRPRGTSPAPPLEEWQGMHSICENSYCRAMGGVIASEKMKVFSNPDSAFSNEVGDKGGKSLGLPGQNQSGLWEAGVVDEQGAFAVASNSPGTSWSASASDVSTAFETRRGASRIGHDGTKERCFEFTGLPTTPTTSAASPLHPNRCPSEIDLDEEHGTNIATGANSSFVGEFAARPETLLIIPAGFSEGAIEDLDDTDIGAADWLETTHALLDLGNESGQACR